MWSSTNQLCALVAVLVFRSPTTIYLIRTSIRYVNSTRLLELELHYIDHTWLHCKSQRNEQLRQAAAIAFKRASYSWIGFLQQSAFSEALSSQVQIHPETGNHMIMVVGMPTELSPVKLMGFWFFGERQVELRRDGVNVRGSGKCLIIERNYCILKGYCRDFLALFARPCRPRCPSLLCTQR